MGSRSRQLRLLKVALGLAVVAGSAMLVSSALGSSFPGTNGKLVYAVHGGSVDKLYTANANGTSQTNITTPAAKQQGDLEPRFSADAKKVVFVRNPEQYGYSKTQIWIADADGALPHQISIKGLPSGGIANAPTFTPDGKTVVFEVDNGGAPAGIWKVSAGGGTATRLTTGNDYHPTVSPDGTQISFIRDTTIMIANADGSDPQALYTEPTSASSIDQPDFSPDGSTIAFMELDSSTLNWDIFTIAADGSDNGTATNLTNGTDFSSLNPTYSPDGTEMAFTSVNNTTYKSSIDVMPATGGAAAVVVNSPKGGVVYSPDWGVETPSIPPHRPTVVRVSPAVDAKSAALTTTVIAAWDEALTSKTLVLTDSHGNTVKGKTTCSAGCSVVTFTPAKKLVAHTTYTAKATGKNRAGSRSKKWSFETK